MPQPTAFQKQRLMRNLRDQDRWSVMDIQGAGAPTNGVTGAGIAGIGCSYKNTTNGVAYINTGTKASPVWTVEGVQTT